jgi:hypothetical protein
MFYQFFSRQRSGVLLRRNSNYKSAKTKRKKKGPREIKEAVNEEYYCIPKNFLNFYS